VKYIIFTGSSKLSPYSGKIVQSAEQRRLELSYKFNHKSPICDLPQATSYGRIYAV